MYGINAKHVSGLVLVMVLLLASLASAQVPPSGLTISKADNPDPVRVGEELLYVLEVTNVSNSDQEAVLTDELPDSVELIAVDPSQGVCEESNGIIVCELGLLGPGENATVQILVEPQEEGNIRNVAQVFSAGDLGTPVDRVAEQTQVLAPDEPDNPDPDNPGGDGPGDVFPEAGLPETPVDQPLEVGQELEEDAVSGDAIPESSVYNEGDNAALCAPVQQTPVTGNQQTGQENIGVGSEDDVLFGSPDLVLAPDQDTACAQTVQPVL